MPNSLKYWWFYPSKLVMYMVLPIYLLCCSLSDESFSLYKHPAKYITMPIFLAGLAGILIFAGMARFAERPSKNQAYAPPVIDPSALYGCTVALFIVTAIGYALMLIPALSHPSLIAQLAAGSDFAQFALKEMMSSESADKLHGTSLVGLQSLFIILASLWSRLTSAPKPIRLQPMIYTVIGLCILRGWLYSERLAVIEILLPYVIIRFGEVGARKRRLLSIGPLFGAIFIYLMFSVGEYFRTWQFFKDFEGGFWAFTWARMVGYYATALNNGAAALTYLPTEWSPQHIAMFLFRLPFGNALGLPAPDSSEGWIGFLYAYTTPEFNNPSGIFSPMMDFGIFIGLLIWGVMGFIAGKFANSFNRGSLGGLIFHPWWMIGSAEILRVFYWGSDRNLLPFITTLLIIAYLKRRTVEPVPAATAMSLAVEAEQTKSKTISKTRHSR